jgi:hypothetical protein
MGSLGDTGILEGKVRSRWESEIEASKGISRFIRQQAWHICLVGLEVYEVFTRVAM